MRTPSPGDLLGALALMGLATYVVAYSYERAFYETFGMSPEDAGHDYTVVVARAATAGVVVAAFIAAALTVTAGAVAVAARLFSDVRAVRTSARALNSLMPRHVLLGSAVAALVLAVPAWSAGEADARRLVRQPRAKSTASFWQAAVGISTPLVTVTWTPPGGEPQTAVARILAVADTWTVYDLNSCLVRRLPSGATAAVHRLPLDTSNVEDPRVARLPTCR